MLLLICSNKKCTLNNRLLIYIPYWKNSKRKCSDFLCFISNMGENIVMIDIKCFISKLLFLFQIKVFLLFDNFCKMEGFHFF